MTNNRNNYRIIKREKIRRDLKEIQYKLYIDDKTIQKALAEKDYNYSQMYYYCNTFGWEKLHRACPVIRAKLTLRRVDGGGKTPSEDMRALIADTGESLTQPPIGYAKFKRIRKNINNPEWVKAHRTGRFVNQACLIGNEPWEVREYLNSRAYRDILDRYTRDEGTNYLWV